MMRPLSKASLVLCWLMPAVVHSQWVTNWEPTYLPASHNWAFRQAYPEADRLFAAFDYGHAILYERLWTAPEAPVADLDGVQFDYITKTLLVKPPRLPLVESAIAPNYVRLVPEAHAMFHWAHLLHRQIYDVLADERLSDAEKDRDVQALLVFYRSRGPLAFSSQPKGMQLMSGQPYSQAFLRKYQKFNGLIWAYHWLQIGLYEALLIGHTKSEREAAVARTVQRFREMVRGAPGSLPSEMPLAPAIAPTFAKRYPEAAIIFDNLHAMHDVISDVLTNPTVARKDKRAEILRAAGRYRDSTTAIVTQAEWWSMAESMGVDAQGGRVR